MSIKQDMHELQSIRHEIKVLNGRRKSLREKEKDVEQRIQDYLRSKDQPGVKYNGTAIILENKEQRKVKKAKDRDRDALDILEEYGIENGQQVLQRILDARRGDPVPVSKLKFTKYKE